MVESSGETLKETLSISTYGLSDTGEPTADMDLPIWDMGVKIKGKKQLILYIPYISAAICLNAQELGFS